MNTVTYNDVDNFGKQKTMGYFEHVLPLKVGQVEPIDIGFPIGSPGELNSTAQLPQGRVVTC